MLAFFSNNTCPLTPCGRIQNPISIDAKQTNRTDWIERLRIDAICLKLHQNNK